jgi:MFS family permease
MPLVSMLAVFGGFMFLNLDDPSSWTIIFTLIGAIVFAVGVLGIFIIKDSPVLPSESGYLKNVIYGFLPSTIKANRSFYITLICYVVFNISVQIFMPYLIIYYEYTLALTNYVVILAPAAIVAAVVAALWGKVYDIKGFDLSVWLSLGALSAGYIMLYLSNHLTVVFIGSLLMMSGYLSCIAVFGAKIRDLTPEGMAGRFQGVRIIAQVLLPGVIGPYIGKCVLRNAKLIYNNDGTTSFLPNANIFLAAFIVAVLTGVLLVVSKAFKKDSVVHLDTPFINDGTPTWDEEHPRLRSREKITSLSALIGRFPYGRVAR